MAYFAELNQDNIVLRVIAVSDADTSDANGVEQEEIGIAFCKRLFGQETIWRKTSYNTYHGEHLSGGVPYRKNYAAIGYKYDEQRDAFVMPKPELAPEDEPYYVFDEFKCSWVDTRPPLPKVELGVTRV